MRPAAILQIWEFNPQGLANGIRDSELLETVGREPKDSYEEMEEDVSPMERTDRQNIAMQQQMSEMKNVLQQQQQQMSEMKSVIQQQQQQMSEMKSVMQQQMSEMKNVMQQQQQQISELKKSNFYSFYSY